MTEENAKCPMGNPSSENAKGEGGVGEGVGRSNLLSSWFPGFLMDSFGFRVFALSRFRVLFGSLRIAEPQKERRRWTANEAVQAPAIRRESDAATK
jgi:hypothetical protein